MSKSDGLKIGIKFTEDLVGDVVLIGGLIEKQDGEWDANGTYTSSRPIDNARDGNISSYWESRSIENYIQINRPTTKLTGFKIYKGSSYRPNSYTISVSENGVDFIEVESGNTEPTTGWETITLDSNLKSDYFRISFGYSSRMYLYELVLMIDECEFSINGQEYKYVNGNLVNKTYRITNLEPHPTEPNSILLTLDWWSKFNNVEGELTVKYDATKGNLTGSGGAVESFEVEFTPTDLVQTPNPGIEEHLKAYPYEIVLGLKEIEFQNRYAEEYLKAYPYEIVLDLKHVSEINP